MSTRATYQFDHMMVKTITFYIHHDGYPEGAASYFWEMHKKGMKKDSSEIYDNLKGGWAEKFMKANPENTEFTISHEAHGDTEYHYTMDKKDHLIAKKVVEWNNEGRRFEVFFEGHYAEFINTYYEGNDKETLYHIDSSTSPFPEYWTLNQVKEKITRLIDQVITHGYKQYASKLELWVKEGIRLGNLTSKQNTYL